MCVHLQKEKLERMMKQPESQKRIGIIHLQMVKESRVLYGMEKFSEAKEVAEMVNPLFKQADREMMVVMSVSAKLEPLALEVVAVGGLTTCYVDIRNIFKHSILNNAAYIICLHNHPSGNLKPSKEDIQVTLRIQEAGKILGIPLIDHIIIGEEGFFSFKNENILKNSLSEEPV